MNFDWFRDLSNLAQTGNFTQAAELSRISQPAFSRRIRSLENWAGITLVDRSRQPVCLTNAGVQLLEAGLQALTHIDSERRQILAAHALPDKTIVRFGAQHSIGWRLFPAWLQQLEACYGPVISRLRADDLPACLQDLEAGLLDFVFAYQSEHSQPARDYRLESELPIESIVIGHDRLMPVSRPDDNGAPCHDLSVEADQIPYLRFGDSAPISLHITPMLIEFGLDKRLNATYENSMVGALRLRACEGDGVAWLPATLIRPDIENGSLVRAGDQYLDIPLDVRLFRLPAHSNHLTREIWAFLQTTDGRATQEQPSRLI